MTDELVETQAHYVGALDADDIDALAVAHDCANDHAEVERLRRELHDARVALDEQRRMMAMYMKFAGEMEADRDRWWKECERVREALEDAGQYLGDEIEPIDLGNHVCGGPDSVCDGECQMAYEISVRNSLIRKIAAALAATEADDGE